MRSNKNAKRNIFRIIGAVILFFCNYTFLGRNGVGWNGIVAFLCSLVLGLIFAYLSIKWGVILSLILIAGASYVTPYARPYFAQNGVNADSIAALITGVGTCAVIIGLPILFFALWRKDRHASYERRTRNEEEGRNCCPKCGRTSIHYIQPHTKPVRNYQGNIVDEEFIDGYWKCSSCKHTWTDDGFSFF